MKRVTLLLVLFAFAIALTASSNDTGVTKETQPATSYNESAVLPQVGVEFITVTDLLEGHVLTYNFFVPGEPIYTDVVIESEDKPPIGASQKSLINVSAINKNRFARDSFRWHQPYSLA